MYSILMSEDAAITSTGNAPIYYGVNSLDERLCVANSLPYAIERSGQAVMGYSQLASSASVNNVQFMLNIPNLSTILDRHIYIRTTCTWTLSGINANAGATFLSNADSHGADCIWGQGMAFGPFPFQSMVQTLTVTINQQPITINLAECLPSLMRIFDKEVLAESCNETPCMLDFFQSYDTAFSAINTAYPSNVLGDASYATALGPMKPRGSYTVTQIQDSANGGTSASITATIIEPLLISPFLIGHMNANQQGMYGIQNISFQFTMKPNNCRSIRVRPAFGNIRTCTLFSVSQTATYLDVTYVTPPSGSKLFLPARNEVPYVQVESQRTQLSSVDAGDTETYTSNDYQLSKLPDKVLISVRKRFPDQQCFDSDSQLPISKVSITFGGNSGIMASTSQQQLWQMAVRNGSNQSWEEFSGYTNIAGTSVPTCGSVVVLAFGRDIPITDPFTVPGSLGSFNFQVSVDATNNTVAAAANGAGAGADIADNTYELFLVFLYGGIFVNELSTSSVVVGMIDKSTVEKVSGEDHQDQNGVRRIYGGSFFSSMGKVLKGLKPLAKPA
ncbi:MAG: hypothetical protein EBQ92_10290, partial [Proteobacteria bacterium]|nr:hypothetical protein [Pseudomonadota bacterium]